MPSFTINFDTKRDKKMLFNHLQTCRGIQQVTTKKVRRYNGRYKFYWAHVLPIIEEKCVVANQYGEPATRQEIHEVLKVKFNPIMHQLVNNRIIIQGDSTRSLSDDKFINDFEEQIIMEFSSAPFYCEFLSREEWNEQQRIKNLFSNQNIKK